MMELPSLNKTVKQSSIRSFFHPKSAPSPPLTQQHHHHLEPEAAEEEPPSEATSEHISKTPPKPVLNAANNIIDREDLGQPDLLPKAVISAIGENHIQPLKRINTLLLPINYPDNFYNNILSPDTSSNLSFVILWNSPKQSAPSKNSKVYTIRKDPQQVVGGIVCRLEQYVNTGTSAVYIQSLALLSPYRSQGLAAALLDAVIRAIVQLPPSAYPTPIYLFAHVWTENTEALTWYKSRGFIVDPTPVQNYYSRLRPGTAFVVCRHITPSDYIRHKPQSTSSSKRSSEDWEMIESPNMVSIPAPPTLPFVAPPPPPTELPQKQNKKSTAKPAQTYLNFPPAPTPPIITPSISPPNPTDLSLNPQSAKPLNVPPPSRPGPATHTESFQNRAPPSEWNDLPIEILSAPNKNALSRTNSTLEADVAMAASAPGSRSSSSSRTSGKKKRLYPAAAFGGVGDKAAQ